MSAGTYTLRTGDVNLSHGWQQWQLLHDITENSENLKIEAFAASGDCFEMLANELDQLAMALPLDSAERFRTLRVIDILLYLQEHHKIVRKYPFNQAMKD
jgi:hypothetical protein